MAAGKSRLCNPHVESSCMTVTFYPPGKNSYEQWITYGVKVNRTTSCDIKK
jgi:hypothetical protein